MTRIDPENNTIASVLDVGGSVLQPVADGNTVWFVAGGDPSSSSRAPAYLIELRADDTIAKRISLVPGFISGGATLFDSSIWVSDSAHPRVIRVPSSS